MRVGVVSEIKTDEYRVALTPAGAHELVSRGHEVVVEPGRHGIRDRRVSQRAGCPRHSLAAAKGSSSHDDQICILRISW